MSKIVLGQKPFLSVQGEGLRLGELTMFVRFFGCTLNCHGFGQLDPTNPETYDLSHLNKNSYKSIDEIPVFTKGCDSSYSWSKNFKHLAEKYDSPHEVVSDIIRVGEEYNLDLVKAWRSRYSSMPVQLCFTGGEPMLYQKEMEEIVDAIENLAPKSDFTRITVETNATRFLNDSFIKNVIGNYDVLLACSPKLHNVSGEEGAIHLDIIEQYIQSNYRGILKFVMNDRVESWYELDHYLGKIKDLIHDENWSIWVMPVGADEIAQNDPQVRSIAEKALRRGLQLTPRAHVGFFGNSLDK